MKCIILVILATFLYASVQSRTAKSYISNFELEVELFKDKELWFPDDNQNPVRATLDPVLKFQFLSDMSQVVIFKLYTRLTGKNYDILNINDEETLAKSQFDPKKPTRFFAHGWISSCDGKSSVKIRHAYLKREDCNVIMIDWPRIAVGSYSIARIYMPLLGEHVASMIDFLVDRGMNLNTTTLIGHSLGAHLVGLAGYKSKNKVNFAVGLDPAWPLYAFCDTDCRITNESAKIVEIIHTNGGFLGNPFAIGDVDFFPNGGGLAQPGCILDIIGLCAHSRSVELYAESILTEIGFYGIECTSDKLEKCDGRIEIMGGIDPISKQAGIYYLETGNKNPFALGNTFDKRNNL